jgi:hypothetical protein
MASITAILFIAFWLWYRPEEGSKLNEPVHPRSEEAGRFSIGELLTATVADGSETSAGESESDYDEADEPRLPLGQRFGLGPPPPPPISLRSVEDSTGTTHSVTNEGAQIRKRRCLSRFLQLVCREIKMMIFFFLMACA